MIYCDANIRECHPDPDVPERPCRRRGTDYVDGYWYCSQHAIQALAGLDVRDYARPALSAEERTRWQRVLFQARGGRLP